MRADPSPPTCPRAPGSGSQRLLSYRIVKQTTGRKRHLIVDTLGLFLVVVLPRRWLVARTFGWVIRNRRLIRDYERLTANSEIMIKIAMIRLMATRLAGQSTTWANATEREALRRMNIETYSQRNGSVTQQSLSRPGCQGAALLRLSVDHIDHPDGTPPAAGPPPPSPQRTRFLPLLLPNPGRAR